MAVTNDKEFRAWLERQPHEVCVAIAYRAAMRVIPIAVLAPDEGTIWSRLALATFRVSVISGIVAVRPTPDVKAIAIAFARALEAAHYGDRAAGAAAATLEYAARAAFTAYDVRPADNAPDAAAYAAAYASGAAEATARAAFGPNAARAAKAAANAAAYADTELDASELMGGVIEIPGAVLASIVDFAPTKTDYLRAGGPWMFWAKWYDRAMAGDPLPWDLQEQIALIPNGIWEAGPEAVAEEIRRIEAEFLSDAVPQAGGIVFDAEAALFRKTTKETERPSLLGATLAQVEGALEDVLSDPSNGLHDRSREVQVLRRMLDRFGNDPQRIEMDCTSVYGSLTRQLVSEELPPSEHNLALREAVDQTAEGIRATDPEIAENRRILSELRLRQMGEDGIAAIEEALPVLEAVSDAELGAEFREDILFLSEQMRLPDRPVLGTEPRNPGIRAAYDEEIRLFKRIADMAILARTAEVIHRIDASAGYKGARIVVTGGGLGALLGALVSWAVGLL